MFFDVHGCPSIGIRRWEGLKQTSEPGFEGDVFFTIESVTENEIKIKGSRFLATVSPLEDKDQAEAFVRSISKKYHDATHVCFAYRIGFGDASLFRYSDSGEPSGTAGRPIMEAIDARQLCFVACAVARYFGGVKLGTGGLSRAYGLAAGMTLDAARMIKKRHMIPFRVAFPYEWTGAVRSLMSKFECEIEKTLYGNDTELFFHVRKSAGQKLSQALIDATAGKIKIQQI